MKIVLQIYLAASGQWAGKFISEDLEIGGIAGCASPDEVEQEARNQGYDIVFIERCKPFI